MLGASDLFGTSSGMCFSEKRYDFGKNSIGEQLTALPRTRGYNTTEYGDAQRAGLTSFLELLGASDLFGHV